MIGDPTMWVHHPVTDAKAEIPKDALPIYRQSGWEPMSDEDVAADAEAAEAQRRATEQAMLDASGAVKAADPAVPDPPVDPAPADDAAPADTTTKDAGKGRAAKTKES